MGLLRPCVQASCVEGRQKELAVNACVCFVVRFVMELIGFFQALNSDSNTKKERHCSNDF